VRVAFLGLGAMGRPMAANLAAAMPTVVWNRTANVARAHSAEHGSTAVAALADLPPVDVVCSCLPTHVEVAEVVEATLGLVPEGALWVDHTSADPAASRATAEQLAAVGVRYLDAPVSGGVDGASAGTLTTMVGGDAAAVEAARPVLEVTCGSIVHVGPVGAGMAVKAVNQGLLAASLRAAAEGLVALQRQGVAAHVALDVINAATGRSFATERLLPERAITRAFPHTFGLDLLAKDARLARSVTADAEVDAPLLALVAELTTAASDALPGADHVELVRVVERAAGTELS
jgi:3-hydroxyisobutyrate dehydrogenase